MVSENHSKFCPYCKVWVMPIPDYRNVALTFIGGITVTFAVLFVLLIFTSILDGILEEIALVFVSLALTLLATRIVYKRKRVCPSCYCLSKCLKDSEN